jgi:hypothetical protein
MGLVIRGLLVRDAFRGLQAASNGHAIASRNATHNCPIQAAIAQQADKRIDEFSISYNA